jgi:predicted TPR repeat methyltransferase
MKASRDRERLAAGELHHAFRRARARAASVPSAVRAQLGSVASSSVPEMAEAPKRIVERGYDAIGDGFREWAVRVQGDPRERFLDRFEELVTPGAAVLDLGCGCGLPTASRLARLHPVTGVDISAQQIAAARRNVPAGTFLHSDMATVDLPAGGFGGAVALYSIIHVPRAEHPGLLERIAGWLAPCGVLLAALGYSPDEGVEDGWLGQPMYFSSHDAATNLRLLTEAGLEVIEAEPVTIHEPEADATFLWVLARRPAAG